MDNVQTLLYYWRTYELTFLWLMTFGFWVGYQVVKELIRRADE